MRYCNNCHRLTGGQPMFCNFCGRTYGVKVCPYRHPNPRTAEVCNQCGSRELSVPHPRVPLYMSALIGLLSVLPGIVLLLMTVFFLISLLRALATNPPAQFELMLIGLFIGSLWWLYMHLPRFLRRFVARLFGKSGGGHGREHEH